MCYPLRTRRIVMLNVNIVVRALFWVLYSFFSKKLLERYWWCGNPQAFWGSNEGNCIPRHLLPPPTNQGTHTDQALQTSLRQSLQARYDWAAKFKLDEEVEAAEVIG